MKALKGAFDRKGKSSGSGTGPTPQSNLDPRLAQPGGTLPISTVLGTGAGTGTGAGGGTGTGGGGTTPGGGGINDATNINDTPRSLYQHNHKLELPQNLTQTFQFHHYHQADFTHQARSVILKN